MDQIILKATNISKSFGNTKALKNVDFHLYKSKIHGLLGENGAGKSSLMNILSGIYQPESGKITIDGNTIKKLNPDYAAQLGIGMVHQEFRLIDNFSIKDNLTLSKSNIYIDDFGDAFKKYSDIFSLSADPSTTINKLSVGEKQKIEIMKLIFNNNKIMLLDEPTAVLTPQETSQLRVSLEKLSEQDDKTIVLITHKLKEIQDFTESIFVLKDGEMVAKDLKTKFRNKEDFKPFKNQSLAMILIVYHVKAWLTCTNPENSPVNDLELYKTLLFDIDVMKSMNASALLPSHFLQLAEKYLLKLDCHLWYISEKLCFLALFSSKLSLADKKNMAQALLKIKIVTNLNTDQNTPKITLNTHMKDLVGPDSWTFFSLLGISTNFLKLDPKDWSDSIEYQEGKARVEELVVVNDACERALGLITEFNKNRVTKDPEQKQYLYQVTRHLRKQQADQATSSERCTKKSMKKYLC